MPDPPVIRETGANAAIFDQQGEASIKALYAAFGHTFENEYEFEAFLKKQVKPRNAEDKHKFLYYWRIPPEEGKYFFTLKAPPDIPKFYIKVSKDEKKKAPGQAGAPWAGGGGQPTGATAQGGHYVTHMIGNVDSKRPVRSWVADPTGAASGAVQPQGAPGAAGGAQGANSPYGMPATTSSAAGGYGSLLSPYLAHF